MDSRVNISDNKDLFCLFIYDSRACVNASKPVIPVIIGGNESVNYGSIIAILGIKLGNLIVAF